MHSGQGCRRMISPIAQPTTVSPLAATASRARMTLGGRRAISATDQPRA
ncbi:MAG: hypothetical protein AW07_02838 [Candidatus Accumulibacter sp. SK-11]|nr:MAG: hypothetical protein AW07_02838 [Candidatus Accumulibacter sp. SK-11]